MSERLELMLMRIEDKLDFLIRQLEDDTWPRRGSSPLDRETAERKELGWDD